MLALDPPRWTLPCRALVDATAADATRFRPPVLPRGLPEPVHSPFCRNESSLASAASTSTPSSALLV